MSAQNELHAQISALQSAGLSHGDALAQLNAQQAMLASLQKKLGSTDPKDLPAISAQIAGAVAAAQGIAQQAQIGTTSAKSSQIALDEACEASRKVSNDFMRDFYERREFDKYLHFTSTQDEQDYRNRERERQEAIRKALSEKTPEGELRANRLAIEQLKDAGAHGADRSENYQPTLSNLTESGNALAHQLDGTATGRRADISNQAKPPAPVPADVIASLTAAKASAADDAVKGHGLTKSAVAPTGLSI